ncbi:pleckstrin homology domain-containing family S member 1 [Rhinophrynus dorsalis]
MDSVCSPQAEVCQETSTTFKESGSKNNRNKGSQVHRMAIIKLKYEQTDPADLEKKEINVLTEHLKNYLTIEEIGERLCVAKWKGPREIGCLFRHGDHIDAMNDIWLNDKNLFYQLLNMSVNKEVRLSVISNKKADTFHMLGCSCV